MQFLRTRGHLRREVGLASLSFLPFLILAGGSPAPQAAETAPPNIVVILTDDQRWDTLWSMPNVRSLLVAEGVNFKNAFAVNPMCCPSRASILTGLYSHHTDVYRNTSPHGGFDAFRDRYTVATLLDRAGYRTGLFGKYLNGYVGVAADYIPPGWDRWMAFMSNNGNGDYFDYSVNVDGTPVSYGSDPDDYSTDVLAGEAASFIRQTQDGTPVFLYLSLRAPHEKAIPAPRHEGDFEDLAPHRPPNYNEDDVGDKPTYIRGLPTLSGSAQRSLDQVRIDQYETLLAVDEAVAEVVEALTDTERLSDTMLVFLSDNGYAWGEHRWAQEKQVPYEESIRLPMVVRYDPIIGSGRTDDSLVLNIDLAPTFAELAGLPPPPVDGQSLVPLLTDPAATWREDLLIEHLEAGSVVPTYCAVRSHGFTYVEYGTGEEELYDLAEDEDPFQLDNVAGDPSYADTIAKLRARMLELCDPPPPASLTIGAYPSAVTAGRSVRLSGSLRVPIVGSAQEQRIRLVRTNPDGSTTPLPDVTTDDQGAYEATDVPPSGGVSSYKATWDGDADHGKAVGTARVTVEARAVTADFDDDGFADLAVGVPYEDLGTDSDAGSANVLYGSPAGPSSSGDQFWTQDSPGVAGNSEPGDRFALAMTAGDFNGDGFADLAVGAPYEDLGSTEDAGAVSVLLGSASGLTSGGNQLWHQDSPGLLDISEAGDLFGYALAAGDLDGDGYDDLAVGAMKEDVKTVGDAGAVSILYGSATGLTAERDEFWSQDSAEVEGSAESGDWFGRALAAGDFDNNQKDDLAVGVPREAIGSDAKAGAVNVLYGSSGGLSSSGNHVWYQDSPGIVDGSEPGDQFGYSLAAGHFDGNNLEDLAIGVPYEDLGDTSDPHIADAGAVTILAGSRGGSGTSEFWNQDRNGVEGNPEAGDRFGQSLAAGDFDGTGISDLAVGIPGEDVGSLVDAGAAAILYATGNGLGAERDQLWHQDSSGIEDSSESGDQFGNLVAVGNFDGAGFTDLVVTVPYEKVSSEASDAGAANVLFGGDRGLSSAGNVFRTQDSSGILDAAEAEDRFGYGVGVSPSGGAS